MAVGKLFNGTCCKNVLLAVVLLGASNFCLADDFLDQAKDAKAFCSKPGFKQLPCGFASAEEIQATTRTCSYCGRIYFQLPSQLPAVVETDAPYSQIAVRTISLACSGRVVVRSVFKVIAQPPLTLPNLQGSSCSMARLTNGNVMPGSSDTSRNPVIRCELQLPAGGGSEAERALRAKEVNCFKCEMCSEGKGCPSKTGVWYSDSYIKTETGCNFNQKDGYRPTAAEITFNAGAKILLAKFEVCSSANCFNQAYEDAKARSARSCVRGKCG